MNKCQKKWLSPNPTHAAKAWEKPNGAWPLRTQVQWRIGKVHLGTSTLTLTCQRIAMLSTRNRTQLLGNDEQAWSFSFLITWECWQEKQLLNGWKCKRFANYLNGKLFVMFSKIMICVLLRSKCMLNNNHQSNNSGSVSFQTREKCLFYNLIQKNDQDH